MQVACQILLSMSSRSLVDRVPVRRSLYDEFDSCREFGCFLCPKLVSCWSIHLSQLYFNCLNSNQNWCVFSSNADEFEEPTLQTTWKHPATDKELGCSFKPVIVFVHLSTNSETRQQNTPASFYSTENHIWVINPGDYSRLKLDATCCHFRTAAVGLNTTRRLIHRFHPANRPLSFSHHGDGVKLCNACSNASFILTTLTYGINILLS